MPVVVDAFEVRVRAPALRCSMAAAASLLIAGASLSTVVGGQIVAEVTGLVIVPCDAVQVPSLSSCTGNGPLSRSDTQALDAALGDQDGLLEQIELTEVAIEPAELAESATGLKDSLLVFVFVDTLADATLPLSFDAAGGLSFVPNDGGNDWTCLPQDDSDCGGLSDESDGVVTANLVNESAVAGDVVTIIVGRADPDPDPDAADADIFVVSGQDTTPTPTATATSSPEPSQTPIPLIATPVTGGNGNDDDGDGDDGSVLLGFIVIGAFTVAVVGAGLYARSRLFGHRVRFVADPDPGGRAIETGGEEVIELRAVLEVDELRLEEHNDDSS